MINKIIPHLLTYPRSGSHYFDDILYKEAKIHFTKSHYLDELFDKNNNKQRAIITIARDPIDSISSYLAIFPLDVMGQEFLPAEKITEYVLMYSFLCENSDYVIDFNDLIKYPESVIKKVLDLLNISEKEYSIFDRNIIPKHKRFIPSSKSLSHYNKNILDDFDIDLCYFYYHKLLEKKVVI
jgi:c-di-GMP-related signal transduction protein